MYVHKREKNIEYMCINNICIFTATNGNIKFTNRRENMKIDEDVYLRILYKS